MEDVRFIPSWASRTPRQEVAILLRHDGAGFAEIAEWLGVSRQGAWYLYYKGMSRRPMQPTPVAEALFEAAGVKEAPGE